MSQPFFRLRSSVPAVILACLPAASFAQEQQEAFSLVCAEGLSLALQSNRSVCKGVHVSGVNIDISADEGAASETDFEDSEWQFTGNVEISVGSTMINADQARFTFSENELVAGELTGDPVMLEDFILDDNVEIRGTAQRILYDNRDATATMEGEVSFRRGTREFLGCDLIYNLNEKSMQSGSSECGVRMRIFPEEDSAARSPPDRP